ncbi:lysozyme inhibitor LprI family protein [Bordetella genomosp. 8]|nr:hypothetical protein [Bordetella genomosp. 8]
MMSTNKFERMRARLTWRIHRLSAHLGTSAAIVLAALLPPGVAHAAGFDCKFAKTQVEHLICSVPKLSKLDDQMKVLFEKIEDETAGHDGETGKLIDPAGEEQARWRTTVRDRCKDAACLESVYVARLAAMRKNWAQALDPADR